MSKKDKHEVMSCEDEIARMQIVKLYGSLNLFIDLYTALQFILDHKKEYQAETNCHESFEAVKIAQELIGDVIDFEVARHTQTN